MDEMVAGLEGPNGSVLVTERNKAALKVLKDTIAAAKNATTPSSPQCLPTAAKSCHAVSGR